MVINIDEKKQDRFKTYPTMDVLKFLALLSEQILAHEHDCEKAVIEQACRMQTAFSFITASLFMLLPVVFEHRGPLTENFIFISFSVITLFLILSLVAATCAQNRRKVEDFPNIDKLLLHFKDNYRLFETTEARQKYYIETISVIQESYHSRTEWRGKWLQWSMYLFYTSIISCLVVFVIALCKIF